MIDEAFDVADLGGGEGGAIEIEGEFVGADKRSLLGGFVGDDFVEGPVEKMGGGVVALDGISAGGIYAKIHRGAWNGGIGALEEVKESGTAFLGIADWPRIGAVSEFAGIADLASHFCVSGGGVENDRRFIFESDDLENRCGSEEGIVTGENGGRFGLDFGEFDDLFFLGGAGSLALLIHQRVEAGGIDDEAAFSGHEFGEVEGKSVGIVELESERCGDRGGLWSGGEAKHLTFKEIDATIEGAVECFFFAEENFFDLFLALAKIGKNVAHFSGEGGDEFGEKGFGESERSAIADGTSEDASEDIIAVCVAGLDAIGDGEAEGTDVIGDHPHRDIDFLGGGSGDNLAGGVRFWESA